MKRLFALLLFLILTGGASAQTLVPPFPNAPTANQEVIGPDGQLYRWDGTKWVHGAATSAGSWAPETNPAGGANNYAPLASPTFTGTVTLPNGTALTSPSMSNPTFTGTLTLPNASVADAALANAYSGIGTCTANQFVSALTRNAAPTCTAPSFAALTNPANGQNNYAPLANPTFTGTTNVANLTGTTTGTWTFPDGSTYTSAGHNNMKALGVGTAVSTTAGELGAFLANVNAPAMVDVGNNSTAAGAYAALAAWNASGPGTTLFAMGPNTGVVGGPMAPGTGGIQYDGAVALNLSAQNNSPIGFWVNNNRLAYVGLDGFESIGTIYAKMQGSPLPTATGSINSAANQFTVANGTGTALVGVCSGIFSVVDTSVTGQAGLYMCGGGQCSLIGSSQSGGAPGSEIWVASTGVPAAGKASVAPGGVGQPYAVYNNQGSTVTYGVTTICARSAN